MTIGKRRGVAAQHQPVAPGNDPAPAAAARTPADQSRAVRSSVPLERPTGISNARSPAADAPGSAPPPSFRGGEGGGARADDSFDSDSENIIVRPDSINASRRDADNARRLFWTRWL